LKTYGTKERLYPVRRPVAAFCAGVVVALLGGLIGLGGAEFRLPLLIAVFEVFPHRAVRINLLISLVTLAVSATARLAFIQSPGISVFSIEVVGMLTGGAIAAWVGASLLARIPKRRFIPIIAVLLIAIAGLLVFETVFAGLRDFVLPAEYGLRASAAVAAGLLVGAVSSLLGVAGGELIIPVLIFLFGADIRTAGTASVLISTPIVLVGVARHWLTGHYRSRTMLGFLVLPMSAGSVLGAVAGGYAAAWVANDLLRIVLAGVLAASAFKIIWSGASQSS
jgi:uncharacterized membrane protein YfcA